MVASGRSRRGAGVRWTPLPKAEAPTEATAEKSPLSRQYRAAYAKPAKSRGLYSQRCYLPVFIQCPVNRPAESPPGKHLDSQRNHFQGWLQKCEYIHRSDTETQTVWYRSFFAHIFHTIFNSIWFQERMRRCDFWYQSGGGAAVIPEQKTKTDQALWYNNSTVNNPWI